MNPRIVLAALLMLPGPALIGCGTSSVPSTEISNEPLTEADIAAAQADMDRASDEERAFQGASPVGPDAGRGR